MIVVWERPDNTHYYRHVKGTYKNYYEGYRNQYGHKVLFVFNLRDYIKYDNFIKRRLKYVLYRLYNNL